jgi:hypothetical protein
MTTRPQALAEIADVRPTCSLAVFKALCEARAYLVAIGETEMHDATDSLQELAENGLVQQIGQDAVQAIMSAAFERVEASMAEPAFEPAEDLPPAPIDTPPPEPEPIPPRSYRIVARDGVASAAELQRDVDQSSRKERTERGPATSTVDAFKYVVSLGDPAHLRRWLARRSSTERQQLKQMVALR